MCGITGFYSIRLSKDEWKSNLNNMAQKLSHRGPDHQGIWFDEKQCIGFAHRRLSILDLSKEGEQPMHSKHKRYSIVFNGEIYNYKDLRRELNSEISFRGNSDTEVLINAIEVWGLDTTLNKIKGMFAFALWNHVEKNLILARDRLGIKPLFYGWNNGSFVFSSECHAFNSFQNFQSNINLDSIALFTKYSYIPYPHSIYHGIYKLPPATYLSIQPKNIGTLSEPIAYWSSYDKAYEGFHSPLKTNFQEASQLIENKLRSSISEHMVSDVPLGTFLSGGIDSTLITTLMQKMCSKKVQTFTIGFNEKGFDEAIHAKKIAQHLGTEHTEIYLQPKEVIDKIPSILNLCDEPFADSSQIPTYFVSQLARQQVKVVLSGDGGDELFCGYVRYHWGEKLWAKLRNLPLFLKKLISEILIRTSSKNWETLLQKCFFFLNEAQLSQKFQRLSHIVTSNSSSEFYHKLVSHEFFPERVIQQSKYQPGLLDQKELWNVSSNFSEQMMYLDLITYLPNDILTKVDRASMGVSLETRVPFLDHELIELAWKLPLNFKKDKSTGKKILKNILYQYIPEEMMERPKMGFGIPIGTWLRGPLREWAESLINSKTLSEQGIWDTNYIQKKWQSHLKGSNLNQYYLWNVLVFQNWMLNHPNSKT